MREYIDKDGNIAGRRLFENGKKIAEKNKVYSIQPEPNRIHITCRNPLTSIYIPVRIHKPADGRVIIPGIQVIEPCILVVIISTVTQRVILPNSRRFRSPGQHRPAPRVVRVLHHQRMRIVINPRYVPPAGSSGTDSPFRLPAFR